MQSPREQQGEIRKTSYVNNAKKQREKQNGKARDLFKKIEETKGIFHARMSTIKDRNGKDLNEAEEIKKRQQEYTKQLYKKCLNYLDNHDGMVTHIEPDILECEVKWALGSITTNKVSAGDGISAELFQILKEDAI